jgi:hypothetical protein
MDILLDYDINYPEPPEEYYDLLGRGWLEHSEEEKNESTDLLPDDLFEI